MTAFLLDFRRLIMFSFKRAARDKKWSILLHSNDLVLDLPRSAAVASFRLLTGHDCLPAYLFHFKLNDSPLCSLCDSGQVFDADHLDECNALRNFKDVTQKYWRARKLMA